MRYLRTSWLMVSALAGPLVSIAGSQTPSPHAVRSAASSTRGMAETLAHKQRQATLAAMQASVDKQRAAIAAGVAASIGKQAPANSA